MSKSADMPSAQRPPVAVDTLDDNKLDAVAAGGRINVVPIKDVTWPAPIYWPQYDG